jgi:hypothetical protein
VYNREESSKLKKEFWTAFGVYMKKYIPVYGEKINWMNFNTNCKPVYFQLDADNKRARFCIDIRHKNEDVRELFYLQMLDYKNILNENLGELIWLKEYLNPTGIVHPCIYIEMHGKSIFNKNDWKDLFIFFEEKIVAIKEFWDIVDEIFIEMENDL